MVPVRDGPCHFYCRLVFSFTDPRKCKLHIDRIHVATNDEIVSKMDDSFWGVPFFMCDLWGIKATLKSNRALL